MPVKVFPQRFGLLYFKFYVNNKYVRVSPQLCIHQLTHNNFCVNK